MATKASSAATVGDLVRRKEELLERYRAARLEELLGHHREVAAREAGHGRYPWKGEYRPKEEVLYWYKQRRRWDRRYLLDSLLAVVVLVTVFFALRFVVRNISPDPNTVRGGRAPVEFRQQEPGGGEQPGRGERRRRNQGD